MPPMIQMISTCTRAHVQERIVLLAYCLALLSFALTNSELGTKRRERPARGVY